MLRSWVGWVMRDVARQDGQIADSDHAALVELIGRTKKSLAQKPKDTVMASISIRTTLIKLFFGRCIERRIGIEII